MAHGKTINPTKFFTGVRKNLFRGRLAQSQVDGMNAILKAWDESVFTDPRWLAYMFATTFHETGGRMLPIPELGGYDYCERMYGPFGKRPTVARQMGNTKRGDGYKYRGRGYVQCTWQKNYLRAGLLIGVDLVNNPDLALDKDIAAKIMFAGMTDAEIIFDDFSDDQNFTFTGRSLEDYFNDFTNDPFNARRIINALDHASIIAETHGDFLGAISYN